MENTETFLTELFHKKGIDTATEFIEVKTEKNNHSIPLPVIIEFVHNLEDQKTKSQINQVFAGLEKRDATKDEFMEFIRYIANGMAKLWDDTSWL